ncbi:BbrUII/HgiDII family restriction enzyme [Methanospirillum sp.]
MSIENEYEITIDLNVLNHLGINLYSNVPAVLSEVVANSWDADATSVKIFVNPDSLVIEDDGVGMSKEEINKKFLTVGYQKRLNGELFTQSGRPVMGRKGIGKLSLFSIAKVVEVFSFKDGYKAGCILEVDEIKKAIETGSADKYYPKAIPPEQIDLASNGTRIKIKEYTRDFNRSIQFLRRRIARRFGIIGEKNDFHVVINGNQVTIADREYFHKIQYLWSYGTHDDAEYYIGLCNKHGNQIEYQTEIDGKVNFQDKEYPITGWLGTVRNSGALKDEEGNENLNRIVIMVRGKLAKENILDDFPEGGIYTKYLIGEINADFLDLDELEDIATSNRQEIFSDDSRYKVLHDWIHGQLKIIQSKWTEERNKSGSKEALKIEVINEWFNTLDRDQQKSAETLFGKINTLGINDEKAKRELFKSGIIAFELFKCRRNLQKLDSVSIDNLDNFLKIFEVQDDIEAALYYQVVEGRLKAIEKLQNLVEEDVIEKTIQELIYDHLWLLDPSWERATENPRFEESVKTAFDQIDGNLTDGEKKGRVDIRYKQITGKHIIVELKRFSRPMNSDDLSKQVTKYSNALYKLLQNTGEENPEIETICIIGKKCTDWISESIEKKSRDSLKVKSIRIVYYHELIHDAYSAYSKFLSKKEEVGKILSILQKIDEL